MKTKKSGRIGFNLEIDTEIPTDILVFNIYHKNGLILASTIITRENGKLNQHIALLPGDENYVQIYVKKRLIYCWQW